MPLYRAFALMLVKVKDTFRKVSARTVHPRANTIIRWIQTDTSARQPKPVAYQLQPVARQLYTVAYQLFPPKSGTAFPKVVRLFRKSYDFFAYQLFPLLSQLQPSESPTTFSHNSYLHRSGSCSRRQERPSHARTWECHGGRRLTRYTDVRSKKE